MALSPWPTSPTALTEATAIVRAALGAQDDATAIRFGATAAALVERYAPGAPEPVKDEAVHQVQQDISTLCPSPG